MQKKTGVVLIEQICSWDCEFRSSVESLVGARSGVEDFLRKAMYFYGTCSVKEVNSDILQFGH